MSSGFGLFPGNRKQWEDVSMVTENYFSCMIMLIILFERVNARLINTKNNSYEPLFPECYHWRVGTCRHKVNLKLSTDYLDKYMSILTSDNTSIVTFSDQGTPTKP